MILIGLCFTWNILTLLRDAVGLAGPPDAVGLLWWELGETCNLEGTSFKL